MTFTTITIVEAGTNGSYVDLMGSASLTRGSVSAEAHSGEKVKLRWL